jgi:hypothetical protein
MYPKHYILTRAKRNRRMELNVQARRQKRPTLSIWHLKALVMALVALTLVVLPGVVLVWHLQRAHSTQLPCGVNEVGGVCMNRGNQTTQLGFRNHPCAVRPTDY